MPSKDLKDFPKDMHARGDGVASRTFTWCRQDIATKEDKFNFDTPEHYVTVDGKRHLVQVDSVADFSSLNTTNLDGRLVVAFGLAASTDGLGGIFYYRATGKSAAGTIDGYRLIAGPGADDYLQRLGAAVSQSAANVAALPTASQVPQGTTYTVDTNLLTYVQVDGVWTTNKSSEVDTDSEWAAMTEMVDGQRVYHTGRATTYTYDTATSSWSWYSGTVTKESAGPPKTEVNRLVHCFDSRAGREYSRVVDGVAKAVDHSRDGTPRTIGPGKCFDFGGSSDHVDGPNIGNMMPEATISAWVYLDGASNGTQGVVSRRSGPSGWAMYIIDDKLQSTITATSTASAAGALSATTWHHCLITWDGTNTYGYVDGEQVLSGAVGTPTTDASNLMLGAITSAVPSSFLNGKIFDARVYERVLSKAEISRIAQMKPGNPDIGPTDTLAWYKGDDGAGTIAYDSSDNGNDGTITAAALATFHDSTTNDKFSFQDELGYGVSRKFDGTSAYEVNVGTLGKTSGIVEFSYSATADSDARILVQASGGTSQEGGIGLDSGTLRVWDGAAWQSLATGLSLNTIYKVKINFTGTEATAYIDGVEKSTVTTDFEYNAVQAVIGGLFVGLHGNRFNGSMHYFRMDGVNLLRSPRNESDPSREVTLGLELPYRGQAPNDPVLSSPNPSFNGTADYATADVSNTPLDFDEAAEITLSAWVYRDSGNSRYAISLREASGNNGIDLGSDPSGFPTAYVATHTSGLSTTSSVAFSGWTHLAVTYDGSTANLYQNGVLVSSNALTGTLKHGLKDITIGAFRSDLGWWDGSIVDVLIYNRALTATEVFNIKESNIYKLSGLVGRYPCCEGMGNVLHNTVGNYGHCAITTAAEATLWNSTQNKTDTILKDGTTIATRYVAASSESYLNSTLGDALNSQAKVSMGGWFYKATGEVASIGTGLAADVARWIRLTWFSDNKVYAEVNDAGSAYGQLNTIIELNKWHHIAFVFDGSGTGNAGRLKLYIDGAAVEFSSFTGTIPTTTETNVGDFYTGQYNSIYYNSMISGVVVETVAWTAEEVLNLYEGLVPKTAYYLPNGDGTEVQKGLVAGTVNGTPDRILVPVGVMPVTVGPGVFQPGQSLDLSLGEANAPVSSVISALLADTTLPEGEGSESPDLFIRDLLNGKGDDRLQIFEEPLTGNELTAVTADVG